MKTVANKHNTQFCNDLKKIIEQKYHTTAFVPTAELLAALNMTRCRFRNIYNQKAVITVQEAANLMAHFNITIGQLMGTKPLYKSQRLTPKVIEFEPEKFRQSILNKHGVK